MMTTVTVVECLKCGQRTVKPPDPEGTTKDLPCLLCEVQELRDMIEELQMLAREDGRMS